MDVITAIVAVEIIIAVAAEEAIAVYAAAKNVASRAAVLEVPLDEARDGNELVEAEGRAGNR